VEFAILGPLEVRAPAGAVPIRRGLPRTLLIALVLRPGQTVSSDFLAELLWGDDDLPRNPANALQIQVSYLRKTLGNAEPDGAALLETRAGGYALVVDRDRVDAHRFESITKQLAPLDTLRSSETLSAALDEVNAALALWRGDALEDMADAEFARGEITRLDELRWGATERRIDLLLQLGRHSEAVGDLSELVQRLPLRERIHEQLVLALYRSGRQAEALRAYEDVRRTLSEELGLDPGPELRGLERAVLHHDPALDWTPPPSEQTAGQSATAPAVESSVHAVAPTGRVPIPLSPLIGRDAELTRLVDLLHGHRALTLTGPAGAGKTRLAIDLAARRTEPVWYVDFSPIDDPALVAPTCAAATTVTLTPGEDAVRSIADTLASRHGLLLLDTCEHVLSAAAELASTVLRAAPNVRVLSTSRRALGLSGEFAWPVPPLALPPPDAVGAGEITSHAAVRLFVERAQAVRPDLDLDDRTAADIAAICLALDGLPLAIELAAARTDLLSPAAIRSRLTDRFDLLVDGGTDAAARQQTLRGAIDWSFELLTSEQGTLFARLGVFAGTFDLDAALEVAGAGLPNALELLASLVKQSMVTRAGSDRYRLLDTLRAYALGVLAELDADDTRARHATYYTQLAERGEIAIRGPEQLEWLDRFRSDINNLRAALEWSLLTGDVGQAARQAGALAWFWTLNGMLTEAIDHLERLVGAQDISAAIRAKCVWGYALLAASLGRLETARDAGYLAAELGRGCGDPAGTAYGLNAAAVAEWALGHHDRSLRAHAEAIELLAKIEDQWGLAVCKVLQARTLFDRHDPDAPQVAREGVEHARRAGDLHVLGIALTQIAQLAIADGDPSAAVSGAAEALDLQEQIGYTEGTVSALHVLGQAQRLAGDVNEARALHRRALALASRIGHAAAMCEAMEDLARAEAPEQPGFACALLRAARAEREARGVPLRQRDAEDLLALERALPSTEDAAGQDHAFTSLVEELTT
jgi:predicted ATPase/DNA-binding SARP family transcriptional activator